MKKTLPTILLILLTISGFAQISLLDTSYNHIGYWILTDTIGLELECSSADNTGRLVTASSYELIIQHKPDGSYDYATRIYPEDLEHLFDTVLTNYQVYDIAALNTGKTLVVGRVTTPMGHRMVLTQLNNEGSVDTTFANNGSFILNNYQGITAIMPYRIRVQPDGKVILCFFASVNNIGQHTALLRLNTNGTLDNTFNNTGVRISDNIGYQFMLFNQAGDIHVPSLKLIGNNYYLGMTQFNSAGDSLQTKILCPYDIFGQFHMSLSNAVINLHGKMYISAFNYGSTNSDSVAIIAVNTDLTLDNTFANGGIAVYNDPTYRLDKLAIAISPTGQLFGISVGQNSNDQLDTRLLVLKYKNNGQLNTAFDGDGVYYQTPPFGIFYSNSPAMPYYVPQQNKLLATAAIRDYDNLLPGNFVFTHGGFRFTDNLLLGVVDNTSNATALSAYPNPIQNNTFCLEYTLPENADITVNLYDLKGQLITNLLNKQTRTKGKNTEQVLLPPGIAKGQYVVELIADQNQIVIKIIVD